MEVPLLFWWIAFGLVIVSSTMCAHKGIQPNPMYRTARRLAAGGKQISGFVATTASLASMIGSLLFGVIVYYVVLRCMC